MTPKLSLVLAVILAGATSMAHAEATNPAVKARQAAMKTIGGSVKALGDMAKGATAFDAAAAQTALDTIAMTAGTVPDLFKAQETDPDSEAKPEIWANWDDFVSKASALGTVADTADVSTPEALGATMGQLGGACKACHSLYKSS